MDCVDGVLVHQHLGLEHLKHHNLRTIEPLPHSLMHGTSLVLFKQGNSHLLLNVKEVVKEKNWIVVKILTATASTASLITSIHPSNVATWNNARNPLRALSKFTYMINRSDKVLPSMYRRKWLFC